MKILPEEIIINAFVKDEGEYAWQRQHIVTALHTISETGYAILGGEVWAVEKGKICSSFPNTLGIRVWNTYPQKPDELWFDYCKRTYTESIRKIEETHLENLVNKEFQQYIYYHPIYIEQNDVKALIPQDKYDIERAEKAIEIGYPAVEPILPELLEWLQDINWPVAGVLAPFLASIGKPLIPHIHNIFATGDELWKYWIINQIINESREVAEAFRGELERIAYYPTKSELTEELNEKAQFTLKKYGWEKRI